MGLVVIGFIVRGVAVECRRLMVKLAAAVGLSGGWFLLCLLLLLSNRLCVLLLHRCAPDHDGLGHHLARHDGTTTLCHCSSLGQLARGDSRNGGGIFGGDHDGNWLGQGAGTRASRTIVHADDVGAGTLDLLCGGRADDGVTAVDGGCNTAAQGWRHALVTRHCGPGGVPQITRHEEMLIRMSTRKGWHGRHQRRRGLWRGAIGDAWNVGDLDDVGGTGENGRGDGLGGLASVPGGIEGAVVLLFLSIATLTNHEPPDEEKNYGQGDNTSDHTTSNSTHIGTTRRGRGVGGRGHTFRDGAAVASLGGHGTGLAIRAGRTSRDGVACFATLEEGAGRREAI